MESDVEQLIKSYRSILFAEEHVGKVEQRVKSEVKRLEELGLIVEKEYADVLKLSSIKAVFNKVLGESRMEKEKQEYLHAVLEYKECEKVIDLLEFEMKILKKKIVNKFVIRTKLNLLIVNEKEAIRKKYPSHGSELVFIGERITSLSSELYELNLSLEMSAKAVDEIAEMQKNLVKAKYSGSWGGATKQNQLLDMKIKNSSIDKAQELSYTIKLTLQELEDHLVHCSFIEASEIQELKMFESFNDLYYDKLISDWIVHSKILDSISYLDKVTENLKKLEQRILAEKKRVKNYRDYQITQKEKLIKKS